MGSVPVRFVIFPEGIVHTKEMAIGRPFGDVLTELSTELRIRRQAMALRLNGKLLGDGQSLESIGHEVSKLIFAHSRALTGVLNVK